MTDLNPVLEQLRKFVADREWQQFHDPKNLAMLLASETGELVAEYRWVANTESDAHSRATGPRERIVSEIGDVGIALLMLCDRIGVDLASAVSDKIVVNAQRYPAETFRGRADRK